MNLVSSRVDLSYTVTMPCAVVTASREQLLECPPELLVSPGIDYWVYPIIHISQTDSDLVQYILPQWGRVWKEMN